MPNSTNTYLAGVNQLSTGIGAGQSLGQSATDKVSVYGKTPVVQADAIVAVTGTVNLTTTINAILSAIRNFGIIA